MGPAIGQLVQHKVDVLVSQNPQQLRMKGVGTHVDSRAHSAALEKALFETYGLADASPQLFKQRFISRQINRWYAPALDVQPFSELAHDPGELGLEVDSQRCGHHRRVKDVRGRTLEPAKLYADGDRRLAGQLELDDGIAHAAGRSVDGDAYGPHPLLVQGADAEPTGPPRIIREEGTAGDRHAANRDETGLLLGDPLGRLSPGVHELHSDLSPRLETFQGESDVAASERLLGRDF